MLDWLAWRLKHVLSYSPQVRNKLFLVDAKRVLAQFTPEQQARYHVLSEQYDLAVWPQICTQHEFVENLYVLDCLTQHINQAPTQGAGLDIGCRNFCHLPALYAFHPQVWSGVEVDAHARYWHGYTRAAYGEFMARQFPGASYRASSLLDLQLEAQCGFIFWSLPFLFIETQRAWRLPETYFAPREMLHKALGLLQAAGSMFIVNQGERERDRQAQLLAELGVHAQFLGQVSSVFSPFKKTRYAWCVTKESN